MSVKIDIFSTGHLRWRPLRMTALTLLRLLFVAQLCWVAAYGQGHFQAKRTQLQDPMFGISYSPSRVHYEPMPTLIRQICPGYEHGSFWVFAHLQRESLDYYVVMGIRPGQDGDPLGAALLIKDSKCYQEDSTRMLSGFVPEKGYGEEERELGLPGLNAPQICEHGPQFPYGIGTCHYILRSPDEESVLRGLVSDALVRGARAFGDAAQFKKAVCVPSLREANSSMPIVQQELTKFCK